MDAPFPRHPDGTGTGDAAGGGPAPAPEPGGKGCRRRACGCCLGAVAVPLLFLLIVAIWLSLGPAPAPADCLPAGVPVRVVIRDPGKLVGSFLTDERWRELREGLQSDGRRPGAGQTGLVLFMFKRAAGDELAVAGEGGGAVMAMRPTLLFRAFERLVRLKVAADADGVRRAPGNGPCYGFIGKTLIASRDRDAVAAALGRRDAILAAPGAAAPPKDARIELRFEADLFSSVPGHRAPAYALDLPCSSRGSGWLRADRALLLLTGQAEFDPAAAAELPPPLPVSGPASARLVPADALGCWVWQAPPGQGRWQAVGRFKVLLEVLGASDSKLGEAASQAAECGADPLVTLAPRLAGERAMSVVDQVGADGRPLLPALSVMIACADPPKDWPAIRQAVEGCYGLPAFDEPPIVGGKSPDPYLLRRKHRGVEIIEAVYQRHPAGPGFRPACGLAGKFAVFSTSRAELERIIDRAAGPAAAGTLAGSPAPAARGGGPRPVARLSLNPRGRGAELVSLAQAVQGILSNPTSPVEPSPKPPPAAPAAVLSMIESLQVEWFAAENGRLRVEVEGELRR
jgi:hypothetical protein